MWQTAQPFDLWVFQEWQSCSAFECFNASLTRVCIPSKMLEDPANGKDAAMVILHIKAQEYCLCCVHAQMLTKVMVLLRLTLPKPSLPGASVIPAVQLRKRKERAAMGCDKGLLVELEIASSSPDQHLYLESFATLFTFKCLKFFSCQFDIYNLVTS